MDALVTGTTLAIIFGFGAAIGSFLNVIIYRLPQHLSFVRPPSRCPRCHTRLRPYDNIPVLGWLLLRGCCRYCRAPISPRYPVVEAATGLLFVATFWQFGVSGLTLGYWTLLSWLLALALIDLDTLTLPNALTQPGLVVGLSFAFGRSWLTSGTLTDSLRGLVAAIAAATLGLWLFEAIAWLGSLAFGRTAMGAGDAKLAAMLGAWLGLRQLLLISFLACLFGALVGIGVIALGWRSRQQPLPFGPFLALGALISVFWGEIIIDTYLELFFSLGAG
ncbi:MAG: prepilin peptidase [Spirulinaceae cyanobacterium RM2_2_10]|nr:prepilin peptidase [Spirulinaceae cyanobacterium SM2_1_0]NJO20449.1 prepilin peptidase [Spirulinaceae cyanobacterium RM2_2_10]